MKSSPLSDLDALFLQPSGWFESAASGHPQDPFGESLPWLTYPAIELLAQVIRPTDRVFEYGLGYGSSWVSRRCEELVSVEHDDEWVSAMSKDCAANHKIVYCPIDSVSNAKSSSFASKYFDKNPNESWPTLDGDTIRRRGLEDRRFIAYASSITSYGLFDLIFIDGMARRLAAHFATPHLKADGLLIFDNSNREEYREAYELLSSLGYRYLPCWGLVPGSTFYTCTSIFFKSIERLPHRTENESLLHLPKY